MNKSLVVAVGLLSIVGGHAWAETDVCSAIALRNVPALESPDIVLKRGQSQTDVTQFQVDKATGKTYFCSQGGECYPTHIKVHGINRQALKMTDCTVDAKPSSSDSMTIFYNLSPVRSAVPRKEMKLSDVNNELQRISNDDLCMACSSNAAWHYVNQPKSVCGHLVRETLEGNPDALKKLEANTDNCQ